MVTYCTSNQVEQVRRSISFAIFFVYCTYLVALLFSKILKDDTVRLNLSFSEKEKYGKVCPRCDLQDHLLHNLRSPGSLGHTLRLAINHGLHILGSDGHEYDRLYGRDQILQNGAYLRAAGGGPDLRIFLFDWRLVRSLLLNQFILKMSNIYINIDNSKIMIAAAFVQYVVYSIFYLVFRSYNPPEDANSNTAPIFDQDCKPPFQSSSYREIFPTQTA